MIRGLNLHESSSYSRENSLDECGRPCDPLSCLLFSALWLRCSQSIFVQETPSAKDVDLTCFTTFLFRDATCLLVGLMSLDWPVNPFSRSDSSRPSLPSLMLPATDYNELLFLLLNVSRWRQGTLQIQPTVFQCTTGWDGCGLSPFRRLAMHYLEHQGVSLDLFSQDKGQTIQVLAPQFRLFGTFLPVNENAGAPAICIHRDLFREDAIVTHVVTSQGRDHFF